MTDVKKVDLSTLLYDLNRQVKDRIFQLKKEHPLLVDYLDMEAKQLEEHFSNVLARSPITAEDEAMVFYNHDRISKNLSKIEHGGFPYLWDDVLYDLLMKANVCNLGITNNWIKVLIATNLLELALNQILKSKNPEFFDQLRDRRMGIVKKSEEVNKILEKENMEKLKRNDIHFINSHRIDADHPIPEFIQEISSNDALHIICAVEIILKQLKPLLEK